MLIKNYLNNVLKNKDKRGCCDIKIYVNVDKKKFIKWIYIEDKVLKR